MREYNCPKCRCGCMFEEKNKMICLNCGAEVPKVAARGVRHSHHYHTYTAGNGQKPVCVQPARPVIRTTDRSGWVQTVRPATVNRPGAGKPQDPRKKKKGCGFWALLYFGLFWLLPVLFELISDLF